MRSIKQRSYSFWFLRVQFFELHNLWAGYSEILSLNICQHNKFEFSILQFQSCVYI